MCELAKWARILPTLPSSGKVLRDGERNIEGEGSIQTVCQAYDLSGVRSSCTSDGQWQL